MADEELVQRIMPHDMEAEQSVLGAMIIDADAVETAQEMLTREDFYSRQNGVIFETITELAGKGRDVDVVTLVSALTDKNLPPETASAPFIQQLITQVPTSANIRSYAEIVLEKSMMRKLIRVCEETASGCYAGVQSSDELIDEAGKRVFDLAQKRRVSDFVPIRTIVLNAMRKVEEAAKIRGHVTGLSTGFKDLDHRTAGLQPSDLVLIAARPSMGKTALALNIAEHIVMREEQCVAIFSLEMSKELLVNRLFAMGSHIDAQKIRTGEMNEGEWTELIDTAGRIASSRLIIDDTPAISVNEMRTKCRKFKTEYGLSAVFIDYLQMMSAQKSSDSRQQEISEISRNLKALARELSVPIVALSQLSRAVESRPNRRPMLSDLRESGAIEQDADVVMFIYRDDYYHPDTEEKGVAEINIAKQRNGPVGTIKLSWQPQLTRFADLANYTVDGGE